MKIAKNYSLVTGLICMILLVLGHMTNITIAVLFAIGFYLCLLVFSNEENIFPLLLFFLPWSTIIKLNPASISFASIATILLFLILLLKKQKISVPILLSSIAIVLITLLSKIVQGYNLSTSYIMNIIMIIAFPMMLFWLKDKVRFERCIFYFAIGIISASIISFIVLDNSNISRFVGKFSELKAKRYCGFYSDPNYFSAHVITAVGGLLLINEKNKEQLIVKIILIFCLIAFGLTSISKSFLIGLLLVLVMWAINLLFKAPLKVVIVLFACFFVGAIIISSGIFSEIIDNYRFRFESAEDVSGLTTGRSDIWKEYMAFLFKNPVKLFIGQGYTDDSYSALGIASHNIIIQLVYQLGLVGIVFFLVWLWSSFPWEKIKNIPLFYMLMWIVSCFTMWIGLDMMFLDDMFLIIMLFYIGIHYLAIQNNKKQNLVISI